MDTYRLFILDAQDNLVSGVDLHSDSDDEALEWSSFVLRPDRAGELWCGTRCVGRIDRAHAGLRAAAARGAPRASATRRAPLMLPASFAMAEALA